VLFSWFHLRGPHFSNSCDKASNGKTLNERIRRKRLWHQDTIPAFFWMAWRKPWRAYVRIVKAQNWGPPKYALALPLPPYGGTDWGWVRAIRWGGRIRIVMGQDRKWRLEYNGHRLLLPISCIPYSWTWSWKRYSWTKRRSVSELHGVTIQRTILHIVIEVRTSSVMQSSVSTRLRLPTNRVCSCRGGLPRYIILYRVGGTCWGITDSAT
jgi:hypothetical protein